MKIWDFRVAEREQSFLGMGDLHRGSKLSNTEAIIKDLDKAKEKKARILFTGDIFDAILPKDKRFISDMLSADLVGKSNKVDIIIKSTAKLLAPYASYIDVIGEGNHEYTLNKLFETNMVQRLVERLNTMAGSKIKYGGYLYYACYKFYYGDKGHCSKRLDILVHHGIGVSAPVTKGIIDIARFRDAGWKYDIFFYGHKHQNIILQSAFMSPIIGTVKNSLRIDYVKSIQTGTYMENIIVSDDMSNWGETKAFAPIKLGGVFVDVKLGRRGVRSQEQYCFEMEATS